jgi:hypothetical protein
MYTIQYEDVSGAHKMQAFDTRDRSRLITHLARFRRPIVAVYEQTTPITKAVRNDLRAYNSRGVTRYAREFMNEVR